MKIIDISRDIFETPVYPGDPEPYIDEIKKNKRWRRVQCYSILLFPAYGNTY